MERTLERLAAWLEHDLATFGRVALILVTAGIQVLGEIGLREDILFSLRRVASYASSLGSDSALAELHGVATNEGNHASFLRRQFADEVRLPGMVCAAVRRFRSASP